MWSMAEEAAEAAEEAPRALMIAAPRCCTVGMKSFSYQSRSTSSKAGLPATLVWARSGYWVALWLPQMIMLSTSVTRLPVFCASWVRARLWSRRVIAVNWRGSRSGALQEAIRALVLAGLPTTSTRTLRLALSLSALPCTEKIAALASSRSLRSMPGPRGRAPTSRAKSTSLKATLGSSVATMSCTSGKAQSFTSMTTPLSASMAWGISSSWRMTG